MCTSASNPNCLLAAIEHKKGSFRARRRARKEPGETLLYFAYCPLCTACFGVLAFSVAISLSADGGTVVS